MSLKESASPSCSEAMFRYSPAPLQRNSPPAPEKTRRPSPLSPMPFTTRPRLMMLLLPPASIWYTSELEMSVHSRRLRSPSQIGPSPTRLPSSAITSSRSVIRSSLFICLRMSLCRVAGPPLPDGGCRCRSHPPSSLLTLDDTEHNLLHANLSRFPETILPAASGTRPARPRGHRHGLNLLACMGAGVSRYSGNRRHLRVREGDVKELSRSH